MLIPSPLIILNEFIEKELYDTEDILLEWSIILFYNNFSKNNF